MNGRVSRTCFNPPLFPPRLFHHGVASFSARPKLTCSITRGPDEIPRGRAQWTPCPQGEQRICVDLKKTCAFARSDVRVATMFRINGGEPKLLHNFGMVSANEAGANFNTQVGPLMLDGSYNPGTTDQAQVCVNFRRLSCGY